MKSKLVVKWNKQTQEYNVTHPHTNVKGYGKTISQAIANWIWWWEVPY